MRLRTLESFWLLKNGLPHTYPMLKQNISTDILVVGGGITGALLSHALIEAGYETTLIDKRDIGLGSTSATTSMLQYEIDTPLYKLGDMIGEGGAATCYMAGIEALDKLGKIITKYDIECGYATKNSLYFAHDAKAKKWLTIEYEIRNRYKLGVKWLNEKELKNDYGIISKGGILSEKAASVDAYQLTHNLIAMNVRRGLKVFDQTQINFSKENKNGIEFKTTDGITIKARKAIYCTGYESTSLLKEKVADLIYTWATISEENMPIPKLFYDTLVWNTEAPYLYMRTTDDNRLLIGGEDSKFKFNQLNNSTKEKKSKTLISKLHDIVPSITFIEDHTWGGVFGTTKDGLPYIGKSPEFNHALFVLGFGGNGITFSIQAMDIITDILKNKPNKLSHYYRFGR